MTAQGRRRKIQRTREHVIAELSFNYLERRVLLRGHALAKVLPDYGIDAVMFTYTKSGELENGDVRFQLKATDRLAMLRDGRTVSLRLDSSHLRYWVNEPLPVILVLYDAQRDQAYWLDIQSYAEEHNDLLDPERESVTVHIPAANRVNVRAIDTLRSRRDEMLARLK